MPQKMNSLTRIIRKIVRARGFDMIHYAPWDNLFATFAIDLILDVGANAGQTYDSFRWAGFKGPICSFEPNPEMFHRLEQKPGFLWQRFQCALSSQSGRLKFNITNDDNACSLQARLQSSPGNIQMVKEIIVPAWRLDEWWPKQGFSAKNVFLKIDAEGHDLEVIKGASGVLDRIPLIMAEVAPQPRYQGEPPLPEVVNFMDQLGFCVCRVEKNSLNRTAGIDTAFDIIFAKRERMMKIQP
jgi:FkbM family methyltransferase